jgi:hypothetical protein
MPPDDIVFKEVKNENSHKNVPIRLPEGDTHSGSVVAVWGLGPADRISV